MESPEPAFYTLRVVVISVSGLPNNSLNVSDTRFLRLTLSSPAVVSPSGDCRVLIESHRTDAVANPTWARYHLYVLDAKSESSHAIC
jgi:hypothetical protein